MNKLALYDKVASQIGTTIVVVAKPTVPGRVKTRLTPALNADQAAAVHGTMLRCVLERIADVFSPQNHVNKILAVDYADEGQLHAATRHPHLLLGICNDDMPWLADWRVMTQGSGDLGERIEYIWRAIGRGPAVFLGVDSPDVPRASLLDAVNLTAGGAHDFDGGVGPVDDGGYWTLACRTFQPALLRGIDWGSSAVLDQTLAAARRAGLRFKTLPPWYDIDTLGDLTALRARLERLDQGPAERALIYLRQQIERICGETPP